MTKLHYPLRSRAVGFPITQCLSVDRAESVSGVSEVPWTKKGTGKYCHTKLAGWWVVLVVAGVTVEVGLDSASSGNEGSR